MDVIIYEMTERVGEEKDARTMELFFPRDFLHTRNHEFYNPNY